MRLYTFPDNQRSYSFGIGVFCCLVTMKLYTSHNAVFLFLRSIILQFSRNQDLNVPFPISVPLSYVNCFFFFLFCFAV